MHCESFQKKDNFNMVIPSFFVMKWKWQAYNTYHWSVSGFEEKLILDSARGRLSELLLKALLH